MGIAKLAAERGWGWIVAGFQLFKVNPLMWIGLLVAYAVVLFVVQLVPLVGTFAANLFGPAVAAGLMAASSRAARNLPPRIEDLFVGFGAKLYPLLVLGALTILAWLLIGIIVTVFFGGAVLMSGGSHMPNETEFAGAILRTVATGAGFAVIGLVALISVLTAMALLFAPALVLLRDIAPIEAMKLSFHACLVNWLPLLVFSIVLIPLAMLAALPFGLGWLVLAPTIVAAVYSAYREIFV